MTDHTDRRPTIIQNDIREDHTILVTGHEGCDTYRHTDINYKCGCVHRSENDCDGSPWSIDGFCDEHASSSMHPTIE